MSEIKNPLIKQMMRSETDEFTCTAEDWMWAICNQEWDAADFMAKHLPPSDLIGIPEWHRDAFALKGEINC